jgi:hypothetical protein
MMTNFPFKLSKGSFHSLNDHNLSSCALYRERLHDGPRKPYLYPLLVLQCVKGNLTEVISFLPKNQRFILDGDGVFVNNLVSV